jgi:hypothetical protein
MVDRFVTAPNLMIDMPLSFERVDAIGFVRTVWWIWPLIVLALGGLYFWKESIKKSTGEV